MTTDRTDKIKADLHEAWGILYFIYDSHSQNESIYHSFCKKLSPIGNF